MYHYGGRHRLPFLAPQPRRETEAVRRCPGHRQDVHPADLRTFRPLHPEREFPGYDRSILQRPCLGTTPHVKARASPHRAVPTQYRPLHCLRDVQTPQPRPRSRCCRNTQRPIYRPRGLFPASHAGKSRFRLLESCPDDRRHRPDLPRDGLRLHPMRPGAQRTLHAGLKFQRETRPSDGCPLPCRGQLLLELRYVYLVRPRHRRSIPPPPSRSGFAV